MVTKRLMWRVVLPTVATAVTTSGIAVAIPYATAWRNNVWAWAAVGVLTLASGGAAAWLSREQQDSGATTGASGTNEITLGRRASIGTLRAFASRENKIVAGTRSHLGQVEVTSGAQAPPTESGAANSLDQRSHAGREPAAIPDDGEGVS